MTWEDLSRAHRDAAQCPMDSGNPIHARAACGRAYYSTYALVTSKLPSTLTFGRGWQNPEHAKFPAYVNEIKALDPDERRRVKTAIRRLRQRREDSDYRPGITVTRQEAKEALRDAEEVRRLLLGG